MEIIGVTSLVTAQTCSMSKPPNISATYLPPTYLPPTYLPTHISTYLCTHSPTYYLPTHPPTYLLPTYSPTYSPTCLSTYQPTHLLTHLPTHIPKNQTKRDFVGANVSYREHALAYPNDSFKTCGGPKALTSTTFNKKRGGKSSSGEQERYILKTHLESPPRQIMEILYIMGGKVDRKTTNNPERTVYQPKSCR